MSARQEEAPSTNEDSDDHVIESIVCNGMKEIMRLSQMLFDGYLRTEILNNYSSHSGSIIIAQDVINLCIKFYLVDINIIKEDAKQKLMERCRNSTDFSEIHVLYQLAADCAKNHEYWLSSQVLKIMLKLDDKIDEENKKAKAEHIGKLGKVMFYWKVYDEARNYFEQSIEIYPGADNYSAYRRLAVLCRDSFKDYEESEKLYLKCLEMKDTEPGINGSYGYLLYLMGDYEEANKRLEIEINANKTVERFMHLYHAMIQRAMGNDAMAEKSLLKELEFIKNEKNYRQVVSTLTHLKESDDANKDYYDEFKELVDNEFLKIKQ